MGVVRLCIDQYEGDDARLGPAIEPVVDRTALNQYIARLQTDLCAVEVHIDLARQHHRIVNRIRTMIPRFDSRGKFNHAKHRTVWMTGTYFSLGAIAILVVVNGESFCRPDHGALRALTQGYATGDEFIYGDHGPAVGVVTGYDAAH